MPVTTLSLSGVMMPPQTFSAKSGAPVNVAPVASGVAISGLARAGSTLTGSYTYSDADTDAEGTSTFRWLRDDVAIGGATSTTFALSGVDVGAVIKFEVTPVAAAGETTGSAVESSGTTAVAGFPIAWYKLDEKTGTTATDSGSGGNDGTMSGGLTGADWVPGLYSGNSLLFDGVGDYVAGPTLPMGTGDRTISAWVKTTVSPTVAGIAGLLESAATVGRHGIYMSSGAVGKARANYDATGTGIVASSTTSVNDGEAHSIVVTYDRDGDMVLYVDGVEEGREDISATSATDMPSNGLTFDIGQYNASGPTPGNYFDGTIDDVRIYDYALSATEVRGLAVPQLGQRLAVARDISWDITWDVAADTAG